MEGARNRIDYLDGMRAIAALSVVLIHYGGFGFRSFGATGNSIVDHGKYGVTMFFVLSAYSLCLSLKGGPIDWRAFYIRRAFRVLPAYFVCCLIAAWYWIAFGDRDAADVARSLLAHLTLTNIFDLRYANDLLLVEWSIPVEFSFYLLFPIFRVLTLRAPLVAAFVMLVGAVPGFVELAYGPFEELYHYRKFTLPLHAFSFFAGMLAFYWIDRIPVVAAAASVVLIPAILICTGETEWSGPGIAALTVALIATCRKSSLGTVLGWPPLAKIGTISFSLYLVHNMALLLAGSYAVGVALSLALTVALYCSVERPAQGLGRRLSGVQSGIVSARLS